MTNLFVLALVIIFMIIFVIFLIFYSKPKPLKNLKKNKKKCAICFRGKCLDNNLNHKNNKEKYIDYKKCIKSVYENILYQNPDIDFDIYLHGWINDLSSSEEIVNAYKPKKYILEKQKDFVKDYENISNRNDILKERYKHLRINDIHNYSQSYFQSIFSYAYSISTVMDLIDEEKNYDYIIHLRYDIYINEKIYLYDYRNNKVYTDHVFRSHSPLFHGDFIYLANQKNTIFFKNFYTFLKKNIFNNNDYKIWVKKIIASKKTHDKGRYKHGIYSNQMIYAYFISRNLIPFKDIIPKIKCYLK